MSALNMIVLLDFSHFFHVSATPLFSKNLISCQFFQNKNTVSAKGTVAAMNMGPSGRDILIKHLLYHFIILLLLEILLLSVFSIFDHQCY